MNQAATWVLMGMFVGILNKVEYCSITESPSALSALLCLCFVWSLRCHSASWSYDHHCCMVHLGYYDVILISSPSFLFIYFFVSFSHYFPVFYLSLCLFFTLVVHTRGGSLSLCPYANYQCVFFLVLQMQTSPQL